MNGFWELVKTWDTSIQVGAFIVVALFVTIVLCQALRTVRVLFRGYPAPEPVAVKPQDCNHDDNLTGQCLKPGGCKTTEECEAVVSSYNGSNLKLAKSSQQGA